MIPRDRRALLVLLLWGSALGLYFAGRGCWELRRNWKAGKARLAQLEGQRQVLQKALDEGNKERAQFAAVFPKDWSSLSMDQLRLKGQDGLLASAQRSGLGGVRLRAESLEQALAGRQMGWTLEGEGTLMQWMDTFDAMEKSQPFMRLHGFRLELPGDPWHPESQAASGEDGPILKGSVKCTWITGL